MHVIILSHDIICNGPYGPETNQYSLLFRRCPRSRYGQMPQVHGAGACTTQAWFHGRWPDSWSQVNTTAKELIPIVLLSVILGPQQSENTSSSSATIRQSLASGNALPSTAGNAVFVQLEDCTPPWHGEHGC